MLKNEDNFSPPSLLETEEKCVEIEGYYLLSVFPPQYIPRHKITYYEVGEQNQNTLICAHGLTRNAHDFDLLASYLCSDFRVILVNYPGRGSSEYFADSSHYNYEVYKEDTVRFLKVLNIDPANTIWLGTSMGGIIGMLLHAHNKIPFKALILNDIGPLITSQALNNIRKYAAEYPGFNSLKDAKAYFKSYYLIGNIPDKYWDYLTFHSVYWSSQDNKYYLNYDPKISNRIEPATQDVDLWFLWNQIQCSILIIQGRQSEILNDETVQEMLRTKKSTLLPVGDAGHAPSLMTEDQIHYIHNWIKELDENSGVVNKSTTGLSIYFKDIVSLSWNTLYNKMISWLGL